MLNVCEAMRPVHCCGKDMSTQLYGFPSTLMECLLAIQSLAKNAPKMAGR